MATELKSSQHPITDFWQAPPEALFKRATIAVVLSKSVSWLERKALDGDGPPFRKLERHALYKKQDVVEFIEKYATPVMSSTSAPAALPRRKGKEDRGAIAPN